MSPPLDMVPADLVRRLVRIARKGDEERYEYPPVRADRVTALIQRAACGQNGIDCVGATLKLIAVYRTKYQSPTAAQILVDALRASPTARRIIARHWSSGRRTRVGADLLPIRSGRAPNINERHAAGRLTVRSLLGNGHDLRSAHFRARDSRRNHG